ncbi:hypothetical protein Lesp02_70570 [Lentzea sp. NBRC 105346]|uniref:hypothetical protein n=1 Tax=Lentzea sp. NBRC 105346 TaxID=3032205 RepID=UPI0024A1024B|nr:hypothetical protein [Lentzea sp. NBRC 105346]GLZ34870.1 hypothetical protein Lesp02_70570 [Lentzea sp. NBRC 105346]
MVTLLGFLVIALMLLGAYNALFGQHEPEQLPAVDRDPAPDSDLLAWCAEHPDQTTAPDTLEDQ